MGFRAAGNCAGVCFSRLFRIFNMPKRLHAGSIPGRDRDAHSGNSDIADAEPAVGFKP